MSPANIRRFINLWPPLLFSGIRVVRIAQDWREVDVQLRLRWWNRNAVGTMFGGSLFAMADPFFALMLQHNLGRGYTIWVRWAEIDFVAPGRGLARAFFRISEATIVEIAEATADGSKHEPEFTVDIADAQGKLIARVRTRLYVRRNSGGTAERRR